MARGARCAYAAAFSPDPAVDTPIRVALVGLPLIMREIVHQALDNQCDITVMPEGAPQAPTVIIMWARNACEAARPEQLLNVSRQRLLVLAADGRTAVMHEVRLVETVYPDVQAADLLAAIRRQTTSRQVGP